MKKKLVLTLFLCFWILAAFKTLASPQLPDYIIIKGDTFDIYTLLVERYFQMQEKVDQGKLFGLSFREGASFSCWRGYQAIYKIDNDSLFVVDIIDCHERESKKMNKSASVEKMKSIFTDKFVDNKVFVDWFSGDMKFPLSDEVLRWDGIFYRIYERETVINISKGKVLAMENVVNYIDDPKRINRKNKNKTSCAN